jgi:hypothetical protein
MDTFVSFVIIAATAIFSAYVGFGKGLEIGTKDAVDKIQKAYNMTDEEMGELLVKVRTMVEMEKGIWKKKK